MIYWENCVANLFFPEHFIMHKKLILKSETLHVLMFVMLDRGLLTFFCLENKSRRPLKKYLKNTIRNDF